MLAEIKIIIVVFGIFFADWVSGTLMVVFSSYDARMPERSMIYSISGFASSVVSSGASSGISSGASSGISSGVSGVSSVFVTTFGVLSVGVFEVTCL